LQPDGKIVLAGHAPRETSGTVHTDLFGLRLNANGSLDSSYNGSGVRFYDLADPGDSDDRGLAVALTSDGIVIAGDQVGASGTDFAVARIRRDDWVVVSADRGGPPTVKVFTPTGTELFRFNAAGPSFKGGIRVAAGDVTGDGVLDLFTTPVSGAAVVKVWDGFTRQPVRTIEVLPGFTGGLSLAVGDVLGDTNVELLAAASKGRAPDVLFFDPLTGDPLKQVRVFNDNFRGSVRIATGNPVTATNKDELLVATGPPTAPVVRIFDGATDELKSEITLPAALGSTFQFAVGPVRNSSLDHLVITPGPGGPSVVRIFEFSTGTQVDKFTVFTPPLPGGLRVAAEQLNVAGPHEIVVAAGPGGPPTVKVLRGDTGVVLSTFRAFGASLTTGLFVLAVFR
jgi:hypothetical protein